MTAREGAGSVSWYLLSAGAGVLLFLGFAGFDQWYLMLVGLAPLLLATDHLSGSQAFRAGLACGFVTFLGGYYWLAGAMVHYSTIPSPLCWLLLLVLSLYHGGLLGLVAWIFRRLQRRRVPALAALPLGLMAVETVYPLLFPSFLGNALHAQTILIQIADLGGPILVSGLVVGVCNAATYRLLQAWECSERLPWRTAMAAAAVLAAVAGYGSHRIADIDAMVANAKGIRVGIVQANMGTHEKRDDPSEGLRRHVVQSERLATRLAPDLILWPETAYPILWPAAAEPAIGAYVTAGRVHVPVLFGGTRREVDSGQERWFNSAFLIDRDGRLVGTYDKRDLLPVAERLPLADRLPWLRRFFPNSGTLTPGTSSRVLEVDDYRLAPLICLEELSPQFVAGAVEAGRPHLLVNLTNDAWFGDTTEPWIRLAMARFRAIEHRRYLVRAANTGVSAVIDAVGRLVACGDVFRRENLIAEVHLLEGNTVYQRVGNLAGWMALLTTIGLARPRSAAAAAPKPREPLAKLGTS